ncbi:hypothetical protein ACB094_12G025500 [Castanea mollissima]
MMLLVGPDENHLNCWFFFLSIYGCYDLAIEQAKIPLLYSPPSLPLSRDQQRSKKKALLPLKIMENNNDNEFTCCHCHRIFFNSLDDFRDHNRVAHAYYHVECNLCQNVFSNSTELQTHRQQRHQPQPPPPAPAPQQQQ